MENLFTAEMLEFITLQRVGRLATLDRNGWPNLVPVCFVYDGVSFYIAIDQKPKRLTPLKLKRVRNILDNPKVGLIFDHYEESWDRLGFVAIQGVAQILTENFDRSAVLRLLGAKYPQYRNMDLRYDPIIQVNVEKFTSWGVFK